MSVRDNRAAELLVHAAGNFIAREAGRSTLITPTRAEVSPDRKNATVYVSVFPDTETFHALTYLDRNRDAFRDFLKKEVRLSHLPFVKFALDEGERNRQHLDDISRGI